MSIDEDTELQDLLKQTLEANGCFAKIRAQLRASIYLALDEDETLQKKECMLNTKLKSSLATEEAVYEPESYLGTDYQQSSKEQLLKDLNISNSVSDENIPILLQIIKMCRNKNFDHNKSQKLNVTTTLDNQQVNSFENISIQNTSNEKEINGNKTFEVNSPMFEENDKRNLNVDKTDQSPISDAEVSPPIVKDGKHSKFDSTKEKLKLTKIEKVKARNSLSPLTDIPPISVNKSRSNEMLLPPLYTKEFKEINSQKELEKMFDLEALDNYEEDFMSESEIDLVLNKGDVQETPKSSLVDERVKRTVNTERGVDLDDGNLNNDRNSSISSVNSNDFEFNSNIDDILTSC